MKGELTEALLSLHCLSQAFTGAHSGENKQYVGNDFILTCQAEINADIEFQGTLDKI